MTAILEFTNRGKDVYIPIVLSQMAKIKKTRSTGIYHRIYIEIKDYDELKEIMEVVAPNTSYGIRIIKVGTFGDKIRKFFKEA